jgi:hypothetical protein
LVSSGFVFRKGIGKAVVEDSEESHLVETLCVLADHHVQFVVAGGVAMVLHGIDRLTLDLDIAVSLEEANLHHFLAALKQLKLVPRAPLPAETILHRDRLEAVIREKNALVFSFWSPSNPRKQLDMFLTRENSFDDLVSDTRTLLIRGRPIKVASRQKLIEMKTRVHPMREKDLSDIRELRRIEESVAHESGKEDLP